MVFPRGSQRHQNNPLEPLLGIISLLGQLSCWYIINMKPIYFVPDLQSSVYNLKCMSAFILTLMSWQHFSRCPMTLNCERFFIASSACSNLCVLTNVSFRGTSCAALFLCLIIIIKCFRSVRKFLHLPPSHFLRPQFPLKHPRKMTFSRGPSIVCFLFITGRDDLWI